MRSRYLFLLSISIVLMLLLGSALTLGYGGVASSTTLYPIGFKAEYKCLSTSLSSTLPLIFFFIKYWDIFGKSDELWSLIEYAFKKVEPRAKLLPRDPTDYSFALSHINARADEVFDFYQDFYWLIRGFDGRFYVVELGYNFTFRFEDRVYRSPVIVEYVNISISDRSMYYEGRYAGKWPFFLLPHELYEGSEVDIADFTLYYEVYGEDLIPPLKLERLKSVSELILNITRNLNIETERLLLAKGSWYEPKITIEVQNNLAREFSKWYNYSFRVEFREPTDPMYRVPPLIHYYLVYDTITGLLVYAQTGGYVTLDPLDYVIPLNTRMSPCFEGWSLKSFSVVTISAPVDSRTETPTTITTGVTTATSPTVTRPPPSAPQGVPGVPVGGVTGVTSRGLSGYELSLIALIIVILATTTLYVLYVGRVRGRRS